VQAVDVFDGRYLEGLERNPDAIGDQFGLEAVDEALGHGVVVGVADRAIDWQEQRDSLTDVLRLAPPEGECP
jgi:hypothetical protein